MSRLDFLNPEEGDWIQVQDLINAKSSTQAHIFAALRDEILRVESNDSASRLTRDGALRLRWLIEEVQGASYRAEGPLDQGTERAMEDVLVYEVYLESEEGFEQHRIAEPLEFLRRTTERESEARDLINSGADLFSNESSPDDEEDNEQSSAEAGNRDNSQPSSGSPPRRTMQTDNEPIPASDTLSAPHCTDPSFTADQEGCQHGSPIPKFRAGRFERGKARHHPPPTLLERRRMRIASLSATIASEAKSQLPEALRVDVPAASLRTPESPQSDSDVQGDRSSANQDDGGNSISSEELQVLRSENDELRRIVAQQDVELGRVGWVIVVTIPVIYALAVWVLSLVSHHA